MKKETLFIGEVIRKIRDEMGISQEELAFRSKLNRTYMGELERNEKSPSFSTLVKLSYGLGIQANQLVKEVEKYMDLRSWFENEYQ